MNVLNDGPSSDRIRFLNNPWPNGHLITHFTWSGRLHRDALWFDLHLETAKYHAEGPGLDEGSDDDWHAPEVWRNFERCIVSSSEAKGFRIADRRRRIAASDLSGAEFLVDDLEAVAGWEWEDLAFYTYCLGHDATAGHVIRFGERNSSDQYPINWSGHIALAYKGETEFRYRFIANIASAPFTGFKVPEHLSDEDAWSWINELVVSPGEFNLQVRESARVFVLR